MKHPSYCCKCCKILYLVIPFILLKFLSAINESQVFSNFLLFLMRVFAIGIFLLIAAGAGHFILRHFSLFSDCSLYNFCLSVTTGFVLVSYGIFFSLIKVAGFNIFAPVILVLLYISFKELSLYWGDLFPHNYRLHKDLCVYDWAAASFLGLLLLYAFYNALVPPFSWDAQVYHLLIPKIYISSHGFSYIPLNVYSNMPLSQQLLYVGAMLIGDDITAKLVHFSMGVLICLSLYCFCRRYLSARAGIIAALLFICNPVIYTEFSRAYIDLGMALFCVWMILSIMEYLKTGDRKYCFLAGLFCGMGMGGKYTMLYAFIGGIVLFIAAPWILSLNIAKFSGDDFLSKPEKKQHMKAFVIFIATAVALVIPWLVKSYLYTGNPVYPLMFRFFNGKEWSAQQSFWLVDWQHSIGMGRTLKDYLLLFFRIFIPGYEKLGYRGFAGALYPFLLLLLPACLMIRKNRKIVMMFALFFAVFFILWGVGSQQLRFLIPGIPILSLICVFGIESVKKMKVAHIYPLLLALAILAPLQLITGRIIPEIKTQGSYFPMLLGRQTRDDFLRPRVRSYGCYEYLLGKCFPEERVLFLFENKSLYCPQFAYADSMFEASYFLNLALEAGTPEKLKSRLVKFPCRYVVIDEKIREAMHMQGKTWIFSKKENRENFTKALDIMEGFIKTHLVKQFEQNHSTVYRFK